MVKQPGHLTSMKKERGAGTSCCGVGAVSGGGSFGGGRRGGEDGGGWGGDDVNRERGATYLELMLAGLSLRRGIQEIDCEDLCCNSFISAFFFHSQRYVASCALTIFTVFSVHGDRLLDFRCTMM